MFYRIRELIKDFFRGIKWFVQRGKRGYSDCDVWGFHFYLAKVIAGGVKELIKFGNSYPIEFNDDGVEWTNILKQIAEGFETIGKTDYDLKKFKNGMKLFAKYFVNLWD